MARIRSIKPEFFTSLAIAQLTKPARLLFVGLWTHVDDDGRCLDESRLIKAALAPLDDDDTPAVIDGLLAELAAHGRIVRYRSGDTQLLQIVGWGEHQKIERRTKSKFPAPSDTDSLTASSVSPHRVLAEGSSPDLDLDLDLDRDLLTTTENGFGTAPGPDPSSRAELALDCYLRWQAAEQGHKIRDVDRWLRTTAARAREERLPALIATATAHPEDTPQQVLSRHLSDSELPDFAAWLALEELRCR